jgi:hypothetical protein
LRAICEQKSELIPRPPIVQALNYMQQDLAVAKKLGDIAGECRAHGNLGSAYFSKGNYKVFKFLDGFSTSATIDSKKKTTVSVIYCSLEAMILVIIYIGCKMRPNRILLFNKKYLNRYEPKTENSNQTPAVRNCETEQWTRNSWS